MTRRERGCVRRALACALVAAAGLVGARVQAEQDFARTGWTLRGGAAIGFENSSALEQLNARLPSILDAASIPNLPAGTTIDVARFDADSALGASLGLGYRLHRRVAVEAAFDWVRGNVDFELGLTLPLLGAQNRTDNLGTWTVWTLTGDVKLYGATGRIQPYATIGVGVMQQEVEVVPNRLLASSLRTAAVPRFGGGVELQLTRHFALDLGAGYLLGTGDLDERDFVSARAGLLGRF